MSEENKVYLFPGGLVKLVKAGSAVIDGQQVNWGNSVQVICPLSKFPAKLSKQAILKLSELVQECEPDFLEHMEACS